MSTPLLTSRVSLTGLDFSAVDSLGVTWYITGLDGWGSPKSTLNVQQRARSLGGWAGDSFLQPRDIAISGVVDAPTPGLLSDAIDRLSAAVSLEDTTLTVWEAGRARTCTVRRADEVVVTDWDFDNGTATWSIQLVALDPRKYGETVTQSTGLPSSSGGLTWPVTFPAQWTGVTNSGTVSIANLGNVTAPVVLRIDGPVTGPKVTHIASGTALVFSSSLTLGSGEYLLIDMEARSVLANGQASRAGWVTSRGWFGAEPGPNQYGFGAQTYNSSALMTVTVPSGAWS